MTLKQALATLPIQMQPTFTSDVEWWTIYHGFPEGAAVEETFARMRGEDVRYRTPWGVAMDLGHWCRGWYYCLRCYGD